MRQRRSRGQSLVETTLILAAFMGLMLGMAGVGETLFVREALASRAEQAVRWGALHPYDAPAIRNIVLYGASSPADGAAAIMGMSAEEIEVDHPGCPGVDCRIMVVIPGQGIRSVEPAEASSLPATN